MIFIIELSATIAFAISGILEARRQNMDLIGVFTLAFITALGGGTLRDVLLNRHPLTWIADPSYALMIFGLSVIGAILFRGNHFHPTERWIVIPDALGLGLFAATGTAYALNLGVSVFVALLLGVITATFGGVLRDLFCAEIPSVFRRTQLYATCAFAASFAYWFIHANGGDHEISTFASIFVGASLRLLALRFDWRLPI